MKISRNLKKNFLGVLSYSPTEIEFEKEKANCTQRI